MSAFSKLKSSTALTFNILSSPKETSLPTEDLEAALSPASCACAQAALEIMQEEPEHRARLQKNLERYRSILSDLELDTWESETPAIPIVLGEKEKVYYFWKALLEKGIYAIISIAPGVPPGKDLIRTAISAAHTDEDLDKIEDALIYAKTKI